MAGDGTKGKAIMIVAGLLALWFLLMGITKLFGVLMVEDFASWGYPRWFHILVGAVEAGAAVALLKGTTHFYGAFAILVVMLGAIFTLLRAGQSDMVVTPIVALALASFVALKTRGAPSLAAA